MPETSVNENRLSSRRENDVRMTQNFEAPNSKTISERMKKPSYSNLRFRVARANETHSPASFLTCECIRHGLGYERSIV